MPFTITDIRTDIDNLLATAIDSSTWTQAIKDESVRQALRNYNDLPVYEVSFTVVTTSRNQDLSTITDLFQLLTLGYPWSDGADLDSLLTPWRYVSDQTVYFQDAQPRTGEIIRVRYRKFHKVSGLDAAASTTVADRHRLLLALYAASYACQLRIRQLSENPAEPKEAVTVLAKLSLELRKEANQRSAQVQTVPGSGVNWHSMGL